MCDTFDGRDVGMPRSGLALALVVLALLAPASGCARKAATIPQRPWADVMTKDQADHLWLSLRIEPLQVRVGQTVTATVALANVSGKPYDNPAGAPALYEVQVTDATGNVVYNSLPTSTPADATSLHVSDISRTAYRFRPDAPGTYFVVACTTNSPQLVTRSVPVVVTVQQ